MLKEKLLKNPLISEIKAFFQSQNEHAYIVGGFLRDVMLNKQNSDIDIVTNKNMAQKLAKEFADSINGYFVELDNINKIYRVVFNDKLNYIDIAECIGESIEDDLRRRDFTINAMAYDIKNDIILDITGSKEDLKNGIIREISKQNILDDPIRIIRALRFQSTLGFELSENLKSIVRENALLLNNTAKERINIELVKLFSGKNVFETLQALDEYNILEQLIPEVKEMRKIPKNSHHHLNLLEHSIETVKQIDCFYDMACKDVKDHLNKELFSGQTRLAYLKLGAFLHDVGKPITWKIEPDTGRHRFIMHDVEGAKIIIPTLKTLKFSKKQIAYIQKIIKNHIYPASIVTTDEVSNKAFLRFYRKMGDEVIDLIAIAYADRMSALGPGITQDMIEKNIQGLDKLLKDYLQEKSKLAPLPKLLDGKEIMEILKIKASPELGKIIEKLKEAQISSEVNTKKEAIEFIKNTYNKKDSFQ